MSIRATLLLDDDVAARLDAETRRRGLSRDEILNEILRRSLDEVQPPAPSGTRFRVQAAALHPRPGLDFDDVEGLLEQLDRPGTS
jgi:hypothetical protein